MKDVALGSAAGRLEAHATYRLLARSHLCDDRHWEPGKKLDLWAGRLPAEDLSEFETIKNVFFMGRWTVLAATVEARSTKGRQF
jgi:hypothetical protein